MIADKIDLDLGIGGTYDDPQVKLLGSSHSSGSSGAADSFQKTNFITSRRAKS